MKRTKLIVVMAAVIFVAGPSGYLLAQHMQGGPMMQPPAQQKSPTAESGERSQQRGPATGSEMGPPYGMGPAEDTDRGMAWGLE